MSHFVNGLRSGRGRLARGSLIFAAWTVVGLTFSGQGYYDGSHMEPPVPWQRVLYTQMTWAYMWALATPFVLRLVRRFPFDRKRWLRNATAHVLFSALCLLVVGLLEHAVLYLTFRRAAGYPYALRNGLSFTISNYTEGLSIYLIIAFLSSAYGYYQKYREGELRASRLEAQLSRAQLEALKMQLHPHFLFNTLHSISALLSKDTEAARTMIARLGDFLRLTLENSGTQEVTLRREMEFLNCYLEIERIRFQDRLTTRVDVQREALDVLVPNLILQPIVENAIRHGIAPRSGPGQIEIRAALKGETLFIRVRDNGPGLPPNRNPQGLLRNGVGLSNTRTRLEHLYGARQRFEIANDPDGGSAVTLEIPLATDDDDAPHLIRTAGGL
ncbi:MAG: histidine kinase [Acidobacteria bacterium]|nr:histidine kinase [Acidobacteriota bacterium]